MDERPAPPEKPKSRVVAALLSLVAPGVGHAFLGQPLRGAVWLLGPLLVGMILVLVANEPSTGRVLTLLFGAIFVGYAGALVDVLAIPARKQRATSTGAVIAFVVAPIVLAPTVALTLRSLVIEAFKVPSGAMIPSIVVGDHLFVDKAVYRKRLPRRGEPFVFKYPEHPDQDFVKRAIAVGGDRLEVRSGHPVINGWEVPSCAVGSYRYTETLDQTAHEGELFVEFLDGSAYLVFFDKAGLTVDYQGPYTVAPGETWVLGDNRNNSHDSRVWFGGSGGGVPASHVKGRARMIWLSPNEAHQGSDLARDPVAPTPELAAPIAKCLASRPAITSPPAKP